MKESPRPKTSGPFKLDDHFIDEIEKDWVRSEKWDKAQVLQKDTDFLHSPLRSADVNGVQYPADRLQRLISNAHTPHLVTTPVNHGFAYGINTSPTTNVTMTTTTPTGQK